MEGSIIPNWWQSWLLVAITINTLINLIVFFKGRKLHIRELLHLKPKRKKIND
tara:strand:+ start:281 stop:439 length:159 start_codon:yes stop_codon:yes gene_type:complete